MTVPYAARTMKIPRHGITPSSHDPINGATTGATP